MPFAFCLAQAPQALAQNWETNGPPKKERAAGSKPKLLDNVGIDQRLNQQVPLDLTFRDESGNTVRLGDYFGDKPVVLSLVYYSCPQLCSQVLNGLTGSLSTLRDFSIGKEYTVLTVSFDPREKPELAAKKKATYVEWYKREGASAGWHFLTGDQEQIDRLTEAVGFHYNWDPASQTFVHASGVMLLTPTGKLSRYFYGIEYSAKDLRLGLVEASDGKIGTAVDQVLLYCFHYDPEQGKYGFVVMNLIRAGGAITLVGVAALIFVMRRKTAQRRRELGGLI
ncbi:MAG TPA: SCO family protein [Blastocatellia bacterium]|nr:SCO family protein [Blastocatellia bacterium]